MKVVLLGVEFHSGNRGCGALAYSICEILKRVCDKKKEPLGITAVQFITTPVYLWGNMEINCIKNEPKKIQFWKKCQNEFKSSDLILDFSMGDSFADIYGSKRFFLASMLKQMAIHSGTKFIMAPQTIGPFSKTITKLWAKHILKNCDECFVRDTLSQEYMYSLCGRKALLTTDVAFSLPYTRVQIEKKSDIIRVGFNPSGLLWMKKTEFCSDKFVRVAYQEYVDRLMRAWSNEDNIEVHLITHVFSDDGSGLEDDMRACMEIHKKYPKTVIERGVDTPMEIKSLISTMDVFIGARMHATIAAFSSGVATIPFSYSRKFEGLYHDLGYHYLISGTAMGTDEAVEKTLEWTKEYTKLKDAVKECQKVIPEKQKVLLDVLYKL